VLKEKGVHLTQEEFGRRD